MCNQQDFQREEFLELISQTAIAVAARWYDGEGGGTATRPNLSKTLDARDDEPTYTIEECCKLIGKSRSTFARRIKQYNAAQITKKKRIEFVENMLPTKLYRKSDIHRMLK